MDSQRTSTSSLGKSTNQLKTASAADDCVKSHSDALLGAEGGSPRHTDAPSDVDGGTSHSDAPLDAEGGFMPTDADGFTTVLSKLERRRLKRRRRKVQLKLQSMNIETESSKGTKRPKESTDSTPGTSSSRPPRKVARTDQASYASAVKRDLTLYVSAAAGEHSLSENEVSRLKSELKAVILNTRTPVHIENTRYNKGMLCISCADADTYEFVKQECMKLKPDQKDHRTSYHIRGPGDLPPTHKAIVHVYADMASCKEEFFKLLAVCNKDLEVNKIHCINVTENKASNMYQKSLTLIMAIEEDAWASLKALDFRPFCGLGRILFRTKKSTVAAVEKQKDTVTKTSTSSAANKGPQEADDIEANMAEMADADDAVAESSDAEGDPKSANVKRGMSYSSVLSTKHRAAGQSLSHPPLGGDLD